jgi:hypothetical protein
MYFLSSFYKQQTAEEQHEYESTVKYWHLHCNITRSGLSTYNAICACHFYNEKLTFLVLRNFIMRLKANYKVISHVWGCYQNAVYKSRQLFRKKIVAFGNVTPCSLVKVYRRVWETLCLDYQIKFLPNYTASLPRRQHSSHSQPWRQNVSIF